MFGARTTVLITRMPAPCAARSKVAPNFSSRSRIRNVGGEPSPVALRNCCAVHSWVGFRVAARWTTWRDPWFSKEEKEQRPEEQVVGLHEVAAPDVVGVVLDEGRPRLAATATLADRAHVLLHGPLADLGAELQELAANPFGTPHPIVGRHLPDQTDGLGFDPAFDVPGPRSPASEHAKPLAMPPQDGLGLHNGQSDAPRGQHRGCEQEAKPVTHRES